MVLWIDDVREPPSKGRYRHLKSVNEVKNFIVSIEESNRIVYDGNYETIEYLDLDHDAGEFASDGGDYIKILDWLEETGRSYNIRIHSANPVGVENMRRIIHRNNWKEIF